MDEFLNPNCVFHAPTIRQTKTVLFLLFLSLCCRLTDPIPTTETSIAPRQRPKAGQTQPNPGILPIQPALTPRKRPTAQAAIQAQGETMILVWCFPAGHCILQSCGACCSNGSVSPLPAPTSCRTCYPGQWSAFATCKCPPAKSSTSTGSSTATSQAGASSAAGLAGTVPGPFYSATSHTSASTAAFLEAAASATAAAAAAGCLLPAAADDASSAGRCAWLCLLHTYRARGLQGRIFAFMASALFFWGGYMQFLGIFLCVWWDFFFCYTRLAFLTVNVEGLDIVLSCTNIK